MKLQICRMMIVFLLWLCLVHIASAQQPAGPGVIEARAMLATNGSTASLGNLPLSLFAFVNGVRQVPPAVSQTDAQGLARFEGLRTGNNISYTLFIKFQDFLYDSAPIVFAAGSAKAEVAVRVHDSPLRITQRHTIIEVSKEGQSLLIGESYIFQNSSDRPLAGGPDAAAQNKRVAFRVTLPPNAFDINLDDREPSEQVFFAASQLLDTVPIQPGQSSFTFSYRLPYERATFAIALNTPFTTTALSLFVAPNVAVRGARLTAQGVERGMQRFSARDLSAGTTLAIELSNLPASLLPLDVIQWTPLVVVSLTLVGALYWLRRRPLQSGR